VDRRARGLSADDVLDGIMKVEIREEQAGDEATVRTIDDETFGHGLEVRIVDAPRAMGR
jgi:predicted N-acetyltransferase YhbS